MRPEVCAKWQTAAEPPYSPAAFRRLAGAVFDFDLDRLAAADPAGDHVLNAALVRPPDAPPLKEAAVLVPVVEREPEAAVLFTLRTPHLLSHAGQVAFPGGKVDPEDGGALEAALREAEEEIGLERRFLDPIGFCDPYLSNSGYRIVPVVAMVRPGFVLAPNPHEVADVFEVPLSFLMSPAHHIRASRVWQGATRHFYEMPFGERYIWGVTAGIVRRLYERVYA